MLIDIARIAGDWPASERLAPLFRRAVRQTIATAELPTLKRMELSIVLSSDNEVRKLNFQYRGVNKPTNVLSFPQYDDIDRINATAIATGPLGDIVFAHEKIVREADDARIPFNDHLVHLLVHGLLHLAGHDHIDAADAVIMENLETATLAELEIPDPYVEELAALESGGAA